MSLSPKGWDRAHKLVDFFRIPKSPNIETPDCVIAAAPNRSNNRSAETVTPLTDALWRASQRVQRFNPSIRKDDVAGLASAITSMDGVVLVSWDHALIPEAIAALPNPPATPPEWPCDRYDVVWILKPRPGGWEFEQAPQMLMPGDRESVIPLSDG